MSEDQSHPHGRPITLMKFSDTGDIVVNSEEIEQIFNHSELEERKIVILSLIGAFRGGKSYFLNYCLRFLYAHYSSISNLKIDDGEFLFKKDNDWMGSRDESLKGFSWRSGVKRDTIGIIMWSDVFLHTIDRTGEKVAIFVMDTQGLFDKHSSSTDNSRIFVLSNLISSIQVLNLANRIQEDQLQYLQLTIEFALFSSTDNSETARKSFQNLLFVIRDWNNSCDYKYGINGGRSYLEDVLQIKPNQKPELQSVRESISSCFDDIACCLLPHPGKGVARGKNYNGSWSEMDDEFRDELKRLIECLLLPDNLIIKKINSMDMTVGDMKQYIKEYLKLFQSNQIPKVSSIYELTVDRFMNKLIEKCLDDYKQSIFNNEDIITEENISTVHEKCKERALIMYDAEKKMGSPMHAATFILKLDEEIEIFFKEYKEQKKDHLEKLKEAREKHEAAIKKDSERKEEITKNIEKIKLQLMEINQKREKNPFLSEVYNYQEDVLNIRLIRDEEELQKLDEKAKRAEAFKLVLISVIAGVSIPFSVVSLAGLAATGVSGLTTISTIGATLDTVNIVSSSVSLMQGIKRFFFRRKNKESRE
ncbi:atlastin-like [Chironomus tepperi]|uniref:atlastin-like n=1 Tax=Chironomus tepperi TaxID=113505 RepID=UPI00391F8125